MTDINQSNPELVKELREQAEYVVEFAKSLHPYNFVQYVRALVEGRTYHLVPEKIVLDNELSLEVLQRLVNAKAPDGKVNVLSNKFKDGKEYESIVISGK